MAEQMLETTAPMPKDVAPLPSMMVAAELRHFSAMRSRSKVPAGTASSMGTPPTVAMDQATCVCALDMGRGMRVGVVLGGFGGVE
jgi:hypothetical protein